MVHVEDRDDRLARSRRRIALFERLLNETTEDPTWRDRGAAPQVHRQIVLFDPSGDGRIAELWGHLDPNTDEPRGAGSWNDHRPVQRRCLHAPRPSTLSPATIAGRTAAIAWLGCDLPDAIAANAPQAHYSEDGGPRLRDFVHAMDPTHQRVTTVIGHSYGGAVVGVADREGLVADRVVHVESAGLGQNVRHVADLPSLDPGGQPRDVTRFSMTAPGDLIAAVQGAQLGGLGLGGDPDLLEGVHRLETGRFEPNGQPGEFIHGPGSHSQVLNPATTAWRNVRAVVRGQPIIPAVERVWVSPPTIGGIPVVQHIDPYQDPDFPGTPTEEFPR